MSAIRRIMRRSFALLAFAVLLTAGCGSTSRKPVFTSGVLEVVAVTTSRLDINISEYRHYTTHELHVDGDKLPDHGFARLLRDPDAVGEQFIHAEAIVLDRDSILLATNTREGSRCWTTRLVANGETVRAETVNKGRVDCTTRQAPPGWRSLYDDAGNLMLVREQPFGIHHIAGYWYPLWIEGDVVALYQKQQDRDQLVVKLARISSAETLAEQQLPMEQFAEPALLRASAQERRQWLFDNFTVAATPSASIRLRPDHKLKQMPPGLWAEYKEMDRRDSEADERVRAIGEAKLKAQREPLMRDEAGLQDAGN